MLSSCDDFKIAAILNLFAIYIPAIKFLHICYISIGIMANHQLSIIIMQRAGIAY